MPTAPLYRDWIPSTPALDEEDLRSPVLTVVHYWAIWDLHDREMDGRLAAICPDYDGRINFRSCDVDRPENRRFLSDIANVPTIGSYFRGLRFKVTVGVRSKTELRHMLDGWLAASGSK